MTEQSRKWAFQVYATAITLFVQILLIHAALTLTDGRLVYTLDDPYIHLSVAESILRGEYGINSGEFASPSSSILYPFLLALGLLVGIGELTPLVLTVPFSLAATWMMAGFVWQALDYDDSPLSVLAALLLGPAIGLAINAAALPMTGMEHSIHVFATILALVGLHGLVVYPLRRSSLAAVVLGTLICATIRFEGLALAVAMIGALVALGLRQQAIVTGAVVALALGLYMVTMTALGLPFFPSSVMTKSDIAAQAGDGNTLGMVAGLLINVWNSLGSRWGVLLALASVALLAAVRAEGPEDRRRRSFLLAVAFILCAHIAAGRYGWFGRYEVYVVAAMLLGLFSLPVVRNRTVSTRVAAPILLLVVGAPYLSNTLKTPAASANIYQQQYQMHRFAQEFFPEPVAVNDLGLVAFTNDNYVLDLWGLGSEEARRLSANNQWTPELLRQITLRRDITYAMIYIDWFKQVPTEWCHIGNLVTSRVTSASDTTSFYLIRHDREEDMRVALQDFKDQLPVGARLDILDCKSGKSDE